MRSFVINHQRRRRGLWRCYSGMTTTKRAEGVSVHRWSLCKFGPIVCFSDVQANVYSIEESVQCPQPAKGD